MASEYATLEAWDIVTLVLYFAIVMGVGIIATVKANKSTASGFFLAGKSMTWLPVCLQLMLVVLMLNESIAGSIFATNMGAPTLIGLSGSAADTGFAPIMFEWHATYMLVFLGWIFVPIYMASGTLTMPEYLKKRYGGQRIRVYYACVCLGLMVLSGLSAEMYAGSLFFQQLLGWNVYLSSVVILAITAVYTIGGGLAAVIWTDALQTIILIIGCIILCGISMAEVGGYEGMTNQYMRSAADRTYLEESLYGNGSCGFVPYDALHIFRGLDSDYPWPGLVFGLTLLATYFFCTNQVIVQRNLAAKNVAHSKAACVLSSYLKILPFFLFVWPGMNSRVLFPNEIGCADPAACKEICDNESGCSNIAFPLLVLYIMPTGLKGLMLAALLAALMSSLTSMFNSGSAMFTIDIYKLIRPKASDVEEVFVGRLFGGVLIVMSLLWLPVLTAIQGSRLWDYIQAVSSYITPAWVVVFLLGIFWRRCTERGSWWGLMAGLVVGVIRMVLSIVYSAPACGQPDERPPVLAKVHYLHFAIILACCTFIVTVGVSILTEPRREEQLRRVTWWTRKDLLEPELTDEEELEDDEDPEPIDPNAPKPTKWVRVKNFVLGKSDKPKEKLTKEQKEEIKKKMTNIDEDPYWSSICDYNAVIAVSLTCFVIGFYA